MFDIGFLELIIVSIVGLLVLGPERLPGAIRTVMAYVNKIRRSFAGIRAEIERELHADEFRQDLHNQGIMQELKEAEKALRKELNPDSARLGKDGYPIDEPYEAPSADKERSAGGKPSVEDEKLSADEPSFKQSPAADQQTANAEASAEPEATLERNATEDTPEDETRAAKP